MFFCVCLFYPECKACDEIDLQFNAEYPASVEKLRNAVRSIQGKARIKTLRAGQMSDWESLEFYSKDSKILLFEPRNTAGGQRLERPLEGAILWTPDDVAMVLNPKTEEAWLETWGEDSRRRIEIAKGSRFDRFLGATYSLDGLDLANELSSGAFQLEGVESHPDRVDWIIAKLSRQFEQGPLSVRQDFVVSFDPKKDWAITDFSLSSGPPFNSVVHYELQTRLVEGVGVVTDRMAYTATKDGQLREKKLFEMLSCEECSLASQDFSLEFLGVNPPGPRRRSLAIYVVPAVAFCLLAGLAIWLRK